MAEKKESAGLKFEEALKRLEEIVKGLEKGDLPLEESLKQFTEGIRLARHCTDEIDRAEKKVEVLLKDSSGAARTAPFNPGEGGGGGAEADEE